MAKRNELRFKADFSDETDNNMELFVWRSGWGLPSIDSECLQVLACVKFCRSTPVKIIECENPWNTEKGIIPYFKHRSKELHMASEIVTYLREKGYGCDFGLTNKQCAEVVAYSHLIEDALQPALLYFSWIHPTNFNDTIRPCYGRRLPWLYKTWYPDYRLRRKAIDLILVKFPGMEYKLESCEPFIMGKAQECIKLLSDKLGTNDYFMIPNMPTSIDALIYSFLAPLLKIPLGHCPLRETIRGTPNLERYIARITHRYFVNKSPTDGASGDTNLLASNTSNTTYGSDGHPIKGVETKSQTNTNTSSSSSSPDQTQFTTSQKVFTFAIGAIAMIAYAYKNGMIELPRRRSKSDQQ